MKVQIIIITDSNGIDKIGACSVKSLVIGNREICM